MVWRTQTDVMYLRQLAIASSQSAQTLLYEGVNLVLFYRTGQIQHGQRAGVFITARP